ncbi:uncharacterized protein TNCV_4829381 [Trichonephila clavipes]|nr:uncharacterized protein TNCV_4829381 [Trichonephila clavipes]
MIWLDSTPIKRENTLGGDQMPPTSLPLPPTSREDMWLDGYLDNPHATQALYIYKHPCLLRDSNPVPTTQQSASLTTMPDGQQNISKNLEQGKLGQGRKAVFSRVE